jgi:hypothetical protein
LLEVADKPTLKKLRARTVGDLDVGDLVRRLGQRGVGIIETINDGFATVAFDRDRREIHPLGGLRQVKPKGHDYDKRRPL